MSNFQKIKIILIHILILNWLSALAKIFVGLLTGSIGILAAGVHSFVDGFSNILGLIGIKIAESPQDSEHPYGHRKFESLASLGIAIIILITSYEFLKHTIERLIHPHIPEITLLGFLIMIISFGIDFFAYRYETFWGKKLKSPVLIADALHAKTHLFITPSVILGMVVIKAGFPILDPIIALFVIAMLLRIVWEIIKETSITLCDRAFIDIAKIKKITMSVNEIKASHQIRTRGDDHFVFLDMHIVLRPNLSLKDAHRVSHNLKEKIMKELPQIKDVVVHIEPDEKPSQNKNGGDIGHCPYH